MILSTPFSRHHRANQNWTNGYSRQNNKSSSHSSNNNNYSKHTAQASTTLLRRPAPEQSAPDRPKQPAESTYKSSTLNRLDLLKQRQQQKSAEPTNGLYQDRSYNPSNVNGQFLRRNVSSLGHYPSSKPNGYSTVNSHHRPDWMTPSPAHRTQIYAPASIASPSELAHYNNRTYVNGISQPLAAKTLNGYVAPSQQQHYAATSVRSVPAYSTNSTSFNKSSPKRDKNSRSGRESALGNLFGTIKRKATSRWSSSTSSSTNGANSTSASGPHRQRSLSSPSGRQTKIIGTNQEPIYANGFLSNIPIEQQQQNGKDNKAKQLEAEEIYAEGAHAIDSNALPRLIEVELLQDPEQWAEGETRTLIEEESRMEDNFQQLQATLINWINDELSEQRIIVKDLRDDLYDGQVLCKLLERLQGIQLDIVEVTQNEQAQKYKLHTVLATFNRILSLQARDSIWARSIQWSVNGIHQKNLVEIMRLLVVLARFYQAPIKLPQNVSVLASTYQKNPQSGQLTKRSNREQLTEGDQVRESNVRLAGAWKNGANSSFGGAMQQRRDAFDALLEQAPDKLTLVTRTLVKFCNRHLEKINITAGQTLDTEQFSDGLLLVFLISSLEGYFVPLGQLFTVIKRRPSTVNKKFPLYQETSLDTLPYIDANNNNNSAEASVSPELYTNSTADFCTALEPTSFTNTQPIEKLHNVNLALQLIEEAGLSYIRQQVRAEDIVNGDLKALLRVLYALFDRYKHL